MNIVHRLLLLGLLCAGTVGAQDTQSFLNLGIGPLGFNTEINYARYTNFTKLAFDTLIIRDHKAERGYRLEIVPVTREFIMAGVGYKMQTFYNPVGDEYTYLSYAYFNICAGMAIRGELFSKTIWMDLGLMAQYYNNDQREYPLYYDYSYGGSWKRQIVHNGAPLWGWHFGVFAQMGLFSIWVNDAADWVMGFSMPFK